MTLETPAFTWSTNLPAATLGNVDTFCKELRKKYDQYCNPQEAKRAAYHMTSAFSDNPRDFLSRVQKAYFNGQANPDLEEPALKNVYFSALPAPLLEYSGC